MNCDRPLELGFFVYRNSMTLFLEIVTRQTADQGTIRSHHKHLAAWTGLSFMAEVVAGN
jgi:hypothetical protein